MACLVLLCEASVVGGGSWTPAALLHRCILPGGVSRMSTKGRGYAVRCTRYCMLYILL